MAGRYNFRGNPLWTIGARLPSPPLSPPLFPVQDPVHHGHRGSPPPSPSRATTTPREESNKEGEVVDNKDVDQ